MTEHPSLSTYEVLISRSYAVKVRIEARSEDEALERIDHGDWSDDDITDSRCFDSQVCDVELVDTAS
jgi:hypothetical protein